MAKKKLVKQQAAPVGWIFTFPGEEPMELRLTDIGPGDRSKILKAVGVSLEAAVTDSVLGLSVLLWMARRKNGMHWLQYKAHLKEFETAQDYLDAELEFEELFDDEDADPEK